MNPIVDKFPSARYVGDMKIENNLNPSTVPRPKVHVVKGELVCPLDPPDRRPAVEVEALLDTGSDITVISDSIRKALKEQRGNIDLHVERRIELWGKPRPVYDLAFVLPGGYPCAAPYGFVEIPKDEFRDVLDASEMLLGQDVMNQFIITFDGPNGTVTICEP